MWTNIVTAHQYVTPAVIAADNIIMFSHLQYPVQNILPAVTLIQRNIILFKPAFRLFTYDKQISVLFDKRHHTVAPVGIDKPAITGYDLFKSHIIHQSHLSF